MTEDANMQQQRTETPYQHLHGSVWLGAGHLLYGKRQLFSQRLKRFDYRDIQALTLRQTRNYVRWHEILLACTLLSWLTLIWVALYRPPGWVLIVLAFPSVGLLTLAVIHRRLGPTCACHIRTAVQVEQLDGFTRVRTSRPLFYRLRDEIGRAQGVDWNEPLPEAELAAWQPPDTAVEPGRPVLERRVPQHREYNGWAHALLFVALLLGGIVNALFLIQMDWLVMALSLLATALLVGALVAALVMQHTRDITRELRVMGWLCTAYLLASNAASGVIAPEIFFSYLLVMDEFSVWEHEAYVLLLIVTMTIEFLLALLGFYFLSRFRGGKQKLQEARQATGGGSPPGFEIPGEQMDEEQP